MPELQLFFGIGITILGVLYLLIALFVSGATFGDRKRPYVLNGVALCILGVSLLGRILLHFPDWLTYTLWGTAGFLALWANREIRARRGS